MLNIKDKVNLNFLISCWLTITHAHVKKSVVFMNLKEFKGNGIFPKGIAILLVQLKGFLDSSWDLVTILVVGGISDRLEMSLLDHIK